MVTVVVVMVTASKLQGTHLHHKEEDVASRLGSNPSTHLPQTTLH